MAYMQPNYGNINPLRNGGLGVNMPQWSTVNWESNDEGTQALLDDVSLLYNDAHAMEFHDQKNKKYALPKLELVTKLKAMIQRAMDGHYNNK